ncbi:MAG: (4Fe-4S)-binding protein [Rikenellaceae bacterium]|nr:(4Fe-4S)-binding protein [Rikenellaceae bacterium]
MNSTLHEYSNEKIVVYWDQSKCVHSGMCHYNLRNVFDPASRPWVKLDMATVDEIVKTIEKCPTGALSYELKEHEELVNNEFIFG